MLSAFLLIIDVGYLSYSQEGVGAGIYERLNLTVEVEGESVPCFGYQLTSNTRNKSILEEGEPQNQKPSKVYKDVIIRGAKENGLPPHYITFLESIPDNGYDGEVNLTTFVYS
jgi:gamma-glutamylcyclotransferase